MSRHCCCVLVASDAWVPLDSLWPNGPHRGSEFHGQAVLEECRWAGGLGQLIHVLVHRREESHVLVDAALEIPHHVAVEVELGLVDEICGHVLLEASASR